MNGEDEKILKRREFAEKCEELAKLGESVPSGGWDVPMKYIVRCLKDWSRQYRNPISNMIG